MFLKFQAGVYQCEEGKPRERVQGVSAIGRRGPGVRRRGEGRYLVAGTAHDGGEDRSWSIIAGEASLAQARSIVAYQSGCLLVVTHDWLISEALTSAAKNKRGSREMIWFTMNNSAFIHRSKHIN